MDYDRTPFTGIINNFMLILDIEQPKTPEQQRLAQLQASSKRASNAVKLERNRQKIQKAEKAIQILKVPILPTPKIPT
jgi:hypothetical protein